MKNEIARREIESLDYYLQNHTNDYSEESHTAMMMAIHALEQEPCEDMISRQAVLDAIAANCIWENEYSLTSGRIKKAVEGLPPVTPQPKMGRWIVNEWGNISCSECGCTAPYDKVYPGESVFGKAIRVKSTFCPTCGAKMKGGKK